MPRHQREVSSLIVSMLTGLILFGCAPLPEPESDMDTIDISEEGGVNVTDNPAKLRPEELGKSKNLIPSPSGMLMKRPPLGFVSVSGYGSSYIPVAFKGPVSVASGAFVALLWQKDLKFLDLAILDGAGGVVSNSIISPVNVTPNGVIFNYGDSQYIFGNAPGAEFRKKLNGTTLSAFTFAGTGNETLYPGAVSRYRSRVVFGNFGLGYERYLVFTDNNDITRVGDSALSSRGFFVGDDGDQIVAIHEIATTGDKLRPSLLVLLRHSAFVITGQPGQTADSSLFGDMEIARLPYNSGCASANTVAVTPYGTIWAGPDNVWMFRIGQGVIPIGAKIREALQQSPDTFMYRWAGAFFDGFYRLAVFSAGQGPDEVSQLGEQWWLDLSDEERVPTNDTTARWYGPQIFNLITDDPYEAVPDLGVPDSIVGTLLFAQDSRPGANPSLYGLDRGWATGGVLFISSYGTQPGVRDISYDSSLTINNAIGTEILVELETKKYGLDKKEAQLQKVFRKGEVTALFRHESYLTFEASTNGSQYIDTINKLVNPFGGMALDVDALDDGTLTEPTQSLAFWPDPATRKPGYDLTFRVYDQAGIVIVEGYNDRFVFSEDVLQEVTATLTPGFYVDIKAFLDHLVAQMTAAGDQTYSHNLTGSAPYAPLIAITGSPGWAPYFQQTGGLSEADLRKTRIIGAWLGFDTSVNPSQALTKTAGSYVPAKRVAHIDIHGISALVQMTGKRSQ